VLRDIPEDLQKRLSVSDVEEVVFVQLSFEEFVHRDAIRFANGREVLLQRLPCGLRLDVLSLSGAEEERTTRAEAAFFSTDERVEGPPAGRPVSAVIGFERSLSQPA
jgi:hypothetical protein